MEDAIALAECFQHTDEVSGALAQFSVVRRPVIEDYQAAAFESMLWFENVAKLMGLSAIELAFSAMTRSGRVSYEDLEKRSPAFIRQYEAERTRSD